MSEMSEKILEHNSPKQFYQADACIVWCSDDRFTSLLEEFIRKRNYKNFDLIKVMGGAKALGDPEEETERLFLLKQIRASINFHQAKKIILMSHLDCELYKEKHSFKDDNEEREMLARDLKEAVHILRNNLPSDVEVEAVIVNFQGITAIE